MYDTADESNEVRQVVSCNGWQLAIPTVITSSRFYNMYDGDSREKLLEAYSNDVSHKV